MTLWVRRGQTDDSNLLDASFYVARLHAISSHYLVTEKQRFVLLVHCKFRFSAVSLNEFQ